MTVVDDPVVVGVDVGTGSARAGVFDPSGRMLGSARRDIALWREPGSIVEQSSDDIWQSVCSAVSEAVARAEVAPERVRGIGFDATCSLVVLGQGGAPLAVGPSEDPARNIIVWMDHRAVAQAGRINATAHPVLRYVGGVISPEMETPKLLWLREHRPQTFDAAWQFMDLADFLTWRASGSLDRSSCTVTCKWTFLAHEDRWDDSYFRQIGLDVLADEGFARIGTRVVDPGTALGQGLTAEAASAFGLVAGTPVGAGLIDAHAGGVGTVGAASEDVTSCMGYVFGTSSCTMTSTTAPVFVPGVWGPYFRAMVPGKWLNEGGQSAAGAAMDRLLAIHPASSAAETQALADAQPLPVWLARRAEEAAGGASPAIELADGLHVVPEFLGNRAPFADPNARAIIAGLTMEDGIDSLVALYVAGLSGIGYGLRQIIETQRQHGAPVASIAISGGAGQQPFVQQMLADATGIPVVETAAAEPVLAGAAMLGAVAGGLYQNLGAAMSAMTSAKATHLPAQGPVAAVHEARFQAFAALQATGRAIR